MAIEKRTLPVPPWKGLYLDGVTIPGGMSRAENVFILPDGSAQRRNYERTLAQSNVTLAGYGIKNVYELRRSDGNRYLFADLNYTDTPVASFGAELVTGASAIASWTDPGARWSYGSSKWSHDGGGVQNLVGLPTVTAASTYQVVVDVTCPAPAAVAGGWTYASADSGQTWTSSSGQSHAIWLQTWTHAAGGGTTALNVGSDVALVSGESYRVRVYATHTAGTSCSVYVGDTLAGTITATGYHEFVGRLITTATYTTVRFVPTNDWNGSISKAFPYVYAKVDKDVSIKKLVNPSGSTNPDNLGVELVNSWISAWYAEVAAQVSQSLTVYLGGTAAGAAITESGTYTYTVTAGDTTAITFVPTAAWSGSVNSCSIQAITYAAGTTMMKTIGGAVTGTTDYEVTWATILDGMTAGDTVVPCWATMQNKAFRVDGTNNNIWMKDASDYHTLGTPSPVDVPAVASTTGGEITAGAYNVYYTYVKKDSDGLYVTEGNPCPAAYIEIAGTAITVAVKAYTDPDVTHIRVYRTLYNESGGNAYFDQEVANETQTVTLVQSDDIIRDLNTILEFDHDVPPLAKYVITAGSRLWFINLPEENGGKSTIRWSILDEPECVPALNYQTFDPNDGDELMGACALSSNLLVFKRRRTWLCDVFSANVVDGVASLTKHILSPNFGCIASGSIQSVGADSAIWLSSEGVILYDGGQLKNISKDRINTIIFNFIDNGAEPYIDSCYLPLRKLYHINFIYRTAGTITSQRHFVYSLDSDTWSEYIYSSSTGTRHYELNFALATDSHNRDVLLVPYLTSTTGALTYVYQSDYYSTTTATSSEILDSAGDGVTALADPTGVFSDSSDNIYTVTKTGDIFKVTTAGVKSCIVTDEQMLTAMSVSPSDPTHISITNCLFRCVDRTNNFFYVVAKLFNYGDETVYLLKISLTGTISIIASYAASGDYPCWIGDAVIYPTSNILLYMKHNTDPAVTTDTLIKVVSPGAGQTVSTYYEFAPYDGGCFGHMDLYGTNLYLMCGDYDTETELYNLKILKFTDITGAVSVSEIVMNDYALSEYTDELKYHIKAVSDSELIFNASEIVDEVLMPGVFRITYASSTWSVEGSVEGIVSYLASLDVSTAGTIAFTCHDDSTLHLYSNTLSLIGSIDLSSTLYYENHAAFYYVESAAVAVSGDYTDNVYKIYPTATYSEYDDPDMYGVIANIVSNYCDLDVPNDKRVSRVYLPISSENAVIGVASIESDFDVNYGGAVHTSGESTEPSGSVQRQTFGHPGNQTWVTTNTAKTGNNFDGTVEPWYTRRVDISAHGQAFRYSIRIGDFFGAPHMTLRLRPPMVECQIRGKLNG